MNSHDDDERQFDSLVNRVRSLPDIGDSDHATDRLERMNWRPEFLHTPQDFLRISKTRLLEELDSIRLADESAIRDGWGVVGMDAAKARYTQASLLVNAAELLWRLRAGDLDAWDLVNELYEDD